MNQFVNEEVRSTFGYRSGYRSKAIPEQITCLRELFPGIIYTGWLPEGGLPEHVEEWFAIPKWQRIAPTYNEAVVKVLDLIKQTRNGNFHNYGEGQLSAERLRQTTQAINFWNALGGVGGEQSDNDILIVPAQFGLLHRGRSVRRAREVMQWNEFGLGAFAVGIMLITHPERLMNYDDLYVDCAGDVFDNPDSETRFDRSPVFAFEYGKVWFNTRWCGTEHSKYGSASAFLP